MLWNTHFFQPRYNLLKLLISSPPSQQKKKKTATAEKVGLKEEKKNEASERIW